MAQIPEALLGYGLRRQRPPGASTWLSWAWRAGPAHPVLAGTLGGATTQTPREPRRLEQTTRTLGAQATRALLDAPPLPVQMETTIKPSSGLPWGPSGLAFARRERTSLLVKLFIKMVLTFPLRPPILPSQLSFLMSEGVSPSLNPAGGLARVS